MRWIEKDTEDLCTMQLTGWSALVKDTPRWRQGPFDQLVSDQLVLLLSWFDRDLWRQYNICTNYIYGCQIGK